MPDRKVHSIIGSTSGAAFYLIESYDKKEDFHLGNCMAGTLGGLLGGVMTDYLDPPNNPNHRKFAHSIIFGSGLVAGLEDLFNWIDGLDIYDYFKYFLKCLVVGYISHLLIDSTTPKSLPIIK